MRYCISSSVELSQIRGFRYNFTANYCWVSHRQPRVWEILLVIRVVSRTQDSRHIAQWVTWKYFGDLEFEIACKWENNYEFCHISDQSTRPGEKSEIFPNDLRTIHHVEQKTSPTRKNSWNWLWSDRSICRTWDWEHSPPFFLHPFRPPSLLKIVHGLEGSAL